MNRILLLFAISLLYCINSFAQQIPNNSFESWAGNEPDSWTTSNQDIGNKFIAVTKDMTDPKQGSNSARLTVITMSIPLVGTYSCIGLFKWNNGKQDTLGYGGIYKTVLASTWTPFEVPINYLSSETPDTMNIVILNSDPLDGTDHTGTILWVDNLSLEYGTVGIEGIDFTKNINIYAERNARQLVLSTSFAQQENLDISLFNMVGIETRNWKRSMQQSTEHLDVNNLPTGTYVIHISSGNRILYTRKITILN